MKTLHCLIVEDEPLAAEVLEDYIAQVPNLKLIKTCPDAIFALEALQQHQIDVIFLDIHLPKLKGLDFLKTLNHPPPVILTTAYHQYALQSYEYKVVDYLLKPIEFSRFLQAVNKLYLPAFSQKNKEQKEGSTPQLDRPFRFFNVNKRKVKVFLDEILYVESLKEYIKIYTLEKVWVTKYQLGNFEAFLQDDNLLRIHRSFLVAKNKIATYSSTDVEINGISIPIGRSYQVQVGKILANL